MRAWCLLVAVASLGCPGPKTVRPRIGDGTSGVAATLDGGTVTLERGPVALLTFAPEAFALGTVPALDDTQSYDPYWLEVDDGVFQPVTPRGLAWRLAKSAAVTAFTSDTLELELAFDAQLSAHLTVTSAGDGRFALRLVPNSAEGAAKVAYVRLRPRVDAAEGFYGLGEVFDQVNHRGKLRPMQLEASLEVESGTNEAHAPVPLLVGTRGWGLFVESRRPGLFDVARKAPDLVEVTFGTGSESVEGLTFHLFAADQPLDITRRYYDVTGYPTLPAPWALGPWIWRDETTGQAQLVEDARRLRELDLATSGLWIDRPYATAVNTFDFDAARFPQPSALVPALNAEGLRVAVWHSPYLEAAAEPLRSEAADAGYFPPKTGALLNPWGPPIDFTRPEAFRWWQSLIGRYRALGIEGFKLDYAEDVVPGLSGNRTAWQFADGSDERTMQSGYTLLYHRAYAGSPADGGFLLCRAARWGDQQNGPVLWPGDIDATLTRYGEAFTTGGREVVGVGGLPSAVVASLSLGPSGLPFFGADTGGYRHSPPNKETWVRWVEQSALSPVMQTGDSSSQAPWEFTAENGRDAEALDLYRQYARLHLRLFPYEWTFAQRLASDGRPIVRALGLAYPVLGVHPNDEYLFGEDLLVAPVVTSGATSRTLVLPPGRWFDWWDGTTYEGGDAGLPALTVPAPLGKLPLFLRAGGVVPMLRPTIDTLAPAAAPIESYASDPGVLTVRLAAPADGSSAGFSLFDGARVGLATVSGGVQLSWTDGATFKAGALLEVLGVPRPQSVALDAAAATERLDLASLEGAPEGWTWSSEMGGELWIRVPPGDHRVLLR